LDHDLGLVGLAAVQESGAHNCIDYLVAYDRARRIAYQQHMQDVLVVEIEAGERRHLHGDSNERDIERTWLSQYTLILLRNALGCGRGPLAACEPEHQDYDQRGHNEARIADAHDCDLTEKGSWGRNP